jgi:hypothetical protein
VLSDSFVQRERSFSFATDITHDASLIGYRVGVIGTSLTSPAILRINKAPCTSLTTLFVGRSHLSDLLLAESSSESSFPASRI